MRMQSPKRAILVIGLCLALTIGGFIVKQNLHSSSSPSPTPSRSPVQYTPQPTPSVSASPLPTSTPSMSLVVPASCAATKILNEISLRIPKSEVIDTKWQPSPDSELADVLGNGGIACSYGIQRAEIGTTIMWVDNSTSIFEKHVASWVAKNYKKIDVAGVDESAAYFLYKPQSTTNEFHIWTLDILIHGMWIQVSATFLNSIDEGASLIKAAIASATA